MRLIATFLASLLIVGCDGNRCLDDGEIGRIMSISRDQQENQVVKIRLKNRAVRVCLINSVWADAMEPGDVLQGPISESFNIDRRQR